MASNTGKRGWQDIIGHWLAPVVVFAVAVAVMALQQPKPLPVVDAAQAWTDWWRYPIERNAAWRLPRADDSLQGVAIAADGRHLLAVGRAGTILVSADGGIAWARQTQINSSLGAVAIAPDGRHAIAIGDDSTIFSSADGGKTWARHAVGNNTWPMSVAFAPNGRDAIAVGLGGMILASNDGGTTWAQHAKVAAALKSVAIAADGRHVIAVGMGGAILVSADGGITWARQTQGTTQLTSVAFSADGRHAIAVGPGGVIVSTADGGTTWARQSQGTTQLTAVAIAADGRLAIVVGVDGTVLSSADGGTTWARQNQGNTLLLSVAFSPDGHNAVAVGVDGTILFSADGGTTWARETRGIAGLAAVAIAADEHHAVAVGAGGTLLSSGDGGTTWAQQIQGRIPLQSVSIAPDGHHAIAAGESGAILSSADGGTTWARQTQGSEPLQSISIAPDGHHAIAAGGDRVILVSEDGGATWARKALTDTQLCSVAIAPDGHHAIAVGADGAILSSADGGTTWARQTQGTAWLCSVSIAADGRHVIAAGYDGMILSSADGGTTWARHSLGGNARLSVAIASEGHRAIAVGSDGKILSSPDAGATWARQSQSSTALSAVAIAPDGRHATAVGLGGTILSSADGGTTWVEPRYARYPAPWFWVATALAVVWLGWALRQPAPQPEDNAAAMAASDAPVATWREDRLAFTPLARGISRFLRHERTTPPLTLAITGDWGRGKSTLMKLVCEDLQRCDWRVVWFNAWHHQTEAQLLPALLDAIGREGVPPWLSWGSPAFRLRLLWIRSKARFAFTVVFALALLAVAGLLSANHNPAALAQMLCWVKTCPSAAPVSTADTGSEGAWLVLATQITTLLIAAVAAIRRMKPFGLDPAVLLSGTLKRVRISDMSAQTSFRTRFAREFAEVTEALPSPLVIVIDDLDRCQPEAVLQIMEAVNFITTAGRCFVIFGMASERVLAGLALSFKDIAAEMAAFAPGDEAPDQDAERHGRQRYARDYLEKLINIEVIVPQRADIAPSAVLGEANPDSDAQAVIDRQTRLDRFEHTVRHRIMPALVGMLIAGLAAAVWFAATSITILAPPLAVQPSAAVTAPVPAAAPSTEPSSVASTEPLDPAERAQFAEGQVSSVSPWWILATAVLMVGWGAWLFWRRLRAEAIIVRDTEAFKQALRIWTPLAMYTKGGVSSPRRIKRFGNRVRYLAMLQQTERVDDERAIDRLFAMWDRFISMMRTRSTKNTQRNHNAESEVSAHNNDANIALSEHRVVALAAIQEQWEDFWSDRLTVKKIQVPHANDPYLDVHKDAIYEYIKQTRATWPPSQDEIKAFDRTLNGVRFAGDSPSDPNATQLSIT